MQWLLSFWFVHIVDWVRFDAAKMVIAFTNGYFVVISTNKDDIGQVNTVTFVLYSYLYSQ